MQGRKAVIAAALGLVLGGTALAQEQRQDRDRDRQDRGRVEQPVRRDGDRDGARNREWQQNQQQQYRRDDDDRNRQWQQNQQWQYRQNSRDRDDVGRTYRTYPNGTYYPNGSYYPNGAYYPNGGYYPNSSYGMYGSGSAVSQAEQIGFTDGVNDARTDMAAGRGYQPTRNGNYKHANRGWNRNMIDQSSYQQAYRQAYLQGYQQAYGQGGYGWPR